MGQYSVVEVAKILGVGEETIRRWIRDGKLEAKRGLGRNGNAIELNAIVQFANQPPRLYIENLIKWLEKNGFSYKRVQLVDDREKGATLVDTMAKTVDAGGTVAKAAMVGMTGAALINPVGITMLGPAIGGALLANGRRKKSAVNYQIKLEDAALSTAKEKNVSDFVVEEDDLMSQLDQGEENDSASSNTSEDIALKIIEEKMKLIKLKQELAQITAQITICENQIEYYTLLQEHE